MKNLLITGASGFIGQHLLTYFEAMGTKVAGFSLRNEEKEIVLPPSYAIIHLAGIAHDLKNAADPEEYYRVNFEKTKRLYDAFIASDARKFIFISSVKAVTDHAAHPLTEDEATHPSTDYGKSKRMAEEYIIGHDLPEGKSYYILRPCMVHGPGNKGNLNLLFRFVSGGLPYPLAAFSNKRSFLSIDNLCFILKELLERNDIPGGIYNAADDEALSTNEIVALLAEAQDRAPRLLHVPPAVIRWIAQAGDIFRLPLNTEKLTKLTEDFLVSNVKLKRALKMSLPMQARSGILKTARSFNHGTV